SYSWSRCSATLRAGHKWAPTSLTQNVAYPNWHGGHIMKGATLLGFALVALRGIALVYQGISYTTHKKVVDIGPIEATKEEHKTIPLPPIVGVIALVGGIVILVRDRK